jgi:hypothetical protein
MGAQPRPARVMLISASAVPFWPFVLVICCLLRQGSCRDLTAVDPGRPRHKWLTVGLPNKLQMARNRPIAKAVQFLKGERPLSGYVVTSCRISLITLAEQ